jgi:cysteinyl-tRNA synthetase (EC 6.1.1.16)
MQIFDTLSRDFKELKTVNGKRLNVFVCGPTVYDKPHLGHARTYIFFDIFIRYLRYKGLRPFYLMNITDIDDKIINKANSENVPYNEISRRYSTEFFKIMKALRNESVNYYAFATDFINEIISQIERLMEKGYAYETSDGVYYSVEKFQDYGKLSHQDITQLKAGARVETNENKKNPLDFALWKKRKPNEPYWNSPWGEGRPGWHIEDTAITERFFGYHYDLHGGGIDLVFPHHEAEIAQMEAISGKPPLVDYWVHTGHLSVENVKMSKSLGNFITVEEILKSYWPESVRLMFIG